MNSIDQLKPEARDKAKVFLRKLDAYGFLYSVLETLRTAETQAAYYAQGREKPESVNKLRVIAGLPPISEAEANRIITKAKKSKHQDGNALDIVPILNKRIPWIPDTPEKVETWKKLGEVGESCGFSWGGRWTPLDKNGLGWDLPHFEI